MAVVVIILGAGCILLAAAYFHMQKKMAASQERVREMLDDFARLKLQCHLSEQEVLFVVENSTDVMWRANADLILQYVSRHEKIFRGYTKEDIIGKPIKHFLTVDSWLAALEKHSGRMQAELEGDRTGSIWSEIEVLQKDGYAIWCEVISTPLRNEQNAIVGYYGILRDISDRKGREENLAQEKEHLEHTITELLSAQQELIRESHTDSLTNLWNRRKFNERFAEEVERTRRYHHPVSLVLVDIDHFKKVNDTYGHPFGDQVLIYLAGVLQEGVRRNDSVYRIGGEEFALVLPETPMENAVTFSQRLRRTVERGFVETEDGKHVHITVSMGVTTTTEGYERLTDIYRKADEALYQAKQTGRNRVVSSDNLHGGSVDTSVVHRLIVLNWDDSFRCGDLLLDGQHRELFEAVDELLALASREGADQELMNRVEWLIAAIAQHFADEEAFLSKIQYSGSAEHAELHRLLMDKLSKMYERMQTAKLPVGEFFEFLVSDVVMRHMLEADHLFFPAVAEHLRSLHTDRDEKTV